jgi:hypothetical protein
VKAGERRLLVAEKALCPQLLACQLMQSSPFYLGSIGGETSFHLVFHFSK